MLQLFWLGVSLTTVMSLDIKTKPFLCLKFSLVFNMARNIIVFYLNFCLFFRYKKHKEEAVQQYGTLSMSMPPPRPPSAYDSSEDDPAPRYETQVIRVPLTNVIYILIVFKVKDYRHETEA